MHLFGSYVSHEARKREQALERCIPLMGKQKSSDSGCGEWGASDSASFKCMASNLPCHLLRMRPIMSSKPLSLPQVAMRCSKSGNAVDLHVWEKDAVKTRQSSFSIFSNSQKNGLNNKCAMVKTWFMGTGHPTIILDSWQWVQQSFINGWMAIKKAIPQYGDSLGPSFDHDTLVSFGIRLEWLCLLGGKFLDLLDWQKLVVVALAVWACWAGRSLKIFEMDSSYLQSTVFIYKSTWENLWTWLVCFEPFKWCLAAVMNCCKVTPHCLKEDLQILHVRCCSAKSVAVRSVSGGFGACQVLWYNH